jgi:hypothetical protein
MPRNDPHADAQLKEATRRALAAAQMGDLHALGQALADREAAMPDASPAGQASSFEDGQTIGLILTQRKREIAAEHARLEHVREGLVTYRGASPGEAGVDVRG